VGQQTRKERIGIDIGRVICETDTDASDGSRITKEIPRAAEVISRLAVERFGPENIFLISKCGPRRQIKTQEWLAKNEFMARAGLRFNPYNVAFCIDRKDKAKMAEELRLTHFIDDRYEVLGHMVKIVKTLIAFNPRPGERTEIQQRIPHLQHIFEIARVAVDWNEVENILLG